MHNLQKAVPAAAPTTNFPAAPEQEGATEDCPALAVEAEGFRLFNKQSGSGRAIAFGTRREDVLAMLAFRGKSETGTNGECGAGALDYASWPDGLGLLFQGDEFVGCIQRRSRTLTRLNV